MLISHTMKEPLSLINKCNIWSALSAPFSDPRSYVLVNMKMNFLITGNLLYTGNTGKPLKGVWQTVKTQTTECAISSGSK